MKKQVVIVHKGTRYKLPTYVVTGSSNGQCSKEIVCVPGTEQSGHAVACILDDQVMRSSTKLDDLSLKNDIF